MTSLYLLDNNTTLRLFSQEITFKNLTIGGIRNALYSNYYNFPSKVDIYYNSFEFDVYLSYQW
jgi:hypothetical protein